MESRNLRNPGPASVSSASGVFFCFWDCFSCMTMTALRLCSPDDLGHGEKWRLRTARHIKVKVALVPTIPLLQITGSNEKTNGTLAYADPR